MNPTSQTKRSHKPQRNIGPATLFAALGDPTRLALLVKLSAGRPCSLSQLAEGSKLTRQAITKHLRVLSDAGLASCTRSGRETIYQLQPEPIAAMHQYLHAVSGQWDEALARLKTFVEC